MTTYYYHIDPGSIASTTSIVEARKQTMKYLKRYRKGNFAYIRTNSFGYDETGQEVVINGILGYHEFVVTRIGKKKTITNVLNKDGTLGRIIKR